MSHSHSILTKECHLSSRKWLCSQLVQQALHGQGALRGAQEGWIISSDKLTGCVTWISLMSISFPICKADITTIYSQQVVGEEEVQ